MGERIYEFQPKVDDGSLHNCLLSLDEADRLAKM